MLRVVGDLRAILAIMAISGAWVAAAVGARIAHFCGRLGAFFALVLLVEFYRRYFFVLSTESLGFVFGAIGFLILFRQNLRSAHVFSGTMFLAMGLATRAGPMFIIAATVLFFALRRRWHWVLLSIAAWILVFSVDAAMLHAIREPGLKTSDYGPIFYGMLHGRDFTFAMEQHPELANVPAVEQNAYIFRIVLRELAARPWLAITGPVVSLLSFVFGPHGFFSFGFYDPDDLYLEHPSSISAGFAAIAANAGVYRLANWFAMVLWGAATTVIFVCSLVRFAIARNRSEHLEFAGFVLVGVVLSSAFTPPWVTEGIQLQSSTLPFLLAFAACKNAPKVTETSEIHASNARERWLWAAPIVAIIALWICALAPARWHRTAPPCAADRERANARVLVPISGTLVEVSAKNEHFSRARVELNALYLQKVHPDLAVPLREFGHAGIAFEATYDACSEQILVIAGDATVLRAWGSRWARVEANAHRGIAFVTDVEMLK